MATEIVLPQLSESVSGGEVVSIKVKVGDMVAQGQALFEVGAEKTTAEVPAIFAGKITKIMVKEGDNVKTGQVLAVVEGDGAGEKPQEEKKPEAKVSQPESKPAPAKEASPKETPPAKSTPTPSPAAKKTPSSDGDDPIVPAGPATRALARDWGVNVAQVPSTGPYGRVTQDDVKDYVRGLANGSGGSSAGGVKVPPLPDFNKWGETEAKPLDMIRKITAQHMSLCWSVIPHVTQFDLADVSDIEAFRKQQEGKGPKLTVTAFVIKATAILLKQHPNFNSSLDWDNKRLIHKHYYNIGIAVDTEKGLVVPVLRDVDKKSVHDIGKEMTEIAEKARLGKLTADDLQGGTFTISNLGGIGGTAFTPIVNWPQVAILGLSRSRMQPVWKDGQFVPRMQMPMSLSYDHRVVDGADAARFARKLAELLENPMVMLLHA